MSAASGGIQPTVEKVTPAQAAKWLENDNYADNRPLDKRWVDCLTRQMHKGLWQSNGVPIQFDVEGKLINGQHRLSAVVASGQTLEFLIVRNVATEAFTTYDQTKIRTPGSVFSMMGEKHGRTLAAICKLVYLWEVYGDLHGPGGKTSPDELNIVLDCYPDLREAASIGERIKRRVASPAPMLGFCWFLFRQAAPRKAETFFTILEQGVVAKEEWKGSINKHPVISLREKLFREKADPRRKGHWNATELFALFVKSWNWFYKGEDVGRFIQRANAQGSFNVPPIRGLGRKQGGRGAKHEPEKQD